jgi:hypothetical protein
LQLRLRRNFRNARQEELGSGTVVGALTILRTLDRTDGLQISYLYLALASQRAVSAFHSVSPEIDRLSQVLDGGSKRAAKGDPVILVIPISSYVFFSLSWESLPSLYL